MRPETGYALFAETFDIMETNPNVRTGLAEHPAGELPEEAVEHLARSAYLAARPRPVHCEADIASIDDSNKPASDAEFLRRTCTILGFGAKGLFYRGTQFDSAAAMNLNAIIRQVRDLLGIADVLDGAAAIPGRNDVSVYPLLAADRALLLFIVRHEQRPAANQTNAAPGTVPAYEQPEDAVLEITPPAWAKVTNVKQLDGAAATAVLFQTTGQRKVVVTMPLPRAATVLMLSIEKEAR